MSRKITIIVAMSLSLCLAFGVISGCKREASQIPKKPVTITFYQRGYSVGGSDVTKVTTTGAFGLYAVVQVDDQDILNAAQALAKYLTGSEVAGAVPN